MPIFFKNVRVAISGQNIMAQSASIDEQNSLVPIFALGYKKNNGTSPSGPIKNSFNISYTLETNKEPNFGAINNLKNYVESSFPLQIVVANITGAGYLTNYSFSIEPNNVIKVNSAYDIYTPLTGIVANQALSAPNSYNLSNGSGVGHYWSTVAKSYDSTQTGAVLQMSYDFNINWQPIYKIGSPYPIEVKFLNATEEFSFVSEYEKRITNTGENFKSQFSDFDIIQINPLSSTWESSASSITLFPCSGKIISNKINISEDSLILQETSVIKYY